MRKLAQIYTLVHWFIFSQKGIMFLGKIKNTGGSKIETGENQVIPASTKGNYKNWKFSIQSYKKRQTRAEKISDLLIN